MIQATLRATCLEASFHEMPEIDLFRHEIFKEMDGLNIGFDSAENEPQDDIF